MVVVATTAGNIIADRDDLPFIVHVRTARFGGVSEEVVEDNVFEATDVLTEFCNCDGSCEVLTDGEVDACLAMKSSSWRSSSGRSEVKDVARQSAAELKVTAEKTALCPDGQRRYGTSRTMACSTP